MLVLSNEDVEGLLTMSECIEALHSAYLDAATQQAVNGRRSDIIARSAMKDAAYSLKVMSAVVSKLEIGALRLNSDVLSFPVVEGKRRKVKLPAAPNGRWVGLVLLFSTRTGEPLAIFPDGVVQRFRVGATSGLGARYLARDDAQTAAIIGTGWQAGAQAMAVVAVRPITQIRCFSPNPERRQRFSDEFERRLGVAVLPADSADKAVSAADIVLCATNSLSAVVCDDWIEPGMHLGSIREGEIDVATLRRADRLIIHDRDNMSNEHLVLEGGAKFANELSEVTDPNLRTLSAVPDLTDLVAGAAAGRLGPADITCFLNFHGLGFQFAATGAVLYRKAIEAGRGRQLPTEWFTQTVHP